MTFPSLCFGRYPKQKYSSDERERRSNRVFIYIHIYPSMVIGGWTARFKSCVFGPRILVFIERCYCCLESFLIQQSKVLGSRCGADRTWIISAVILTSWNRLWGVNEGEVEEGSIYAPRCELASPWAKMLHVSNHAFSSVQILVLIRRHFIVLSRPCFLAEAQAAHAVPLCFFWSSEISDRSWSVLPKVLIRE